MALSLGSERSLAAATRTRPFAAFMRWIADGLEALLELDDSRLHDLGISRHDIAQALAHRPRGAMLLNAARARNSSL
jgi:uncharacterized protein YjiS (DUF1127 family)